MIEFSKSRPLEVTMDIKVNGYDIDIMGIISNIVYIRWLEDMRTRLIEDFYPVDEMIDSGVSPVLRETTAEYLRPVNIHHRPVASMWVKCMTKSKWTVQCEILVDGNLHFRGEQTGYFFDLKRERVTKIPKPLMDRFVLFSH